MILEEGKLPRKIAEEILTMELKLKKELHGEYRMHEFEPEFDHNNPTGLRIDWSRGSWTFTPSYQPPIKIGPGITSHFGMGGGGDLFIPWGTVVSSMTTRSILLRRVGLSSSMGLAALSGPRCNFLFTED